MCLSNCTTIHRGHREGRICTEAARYSIPKKYPPQRQDFFEEQFYFGGELCQVLEKGGDCSSSVDFEDSPPQQKE